MTLEELSEEGLAHLLRAEKNNEGQEHMCEECPKGFSTAQALNAHMRSHKSDLCPHCGESFVVTGLGTHKKYCKAAVERELIAVEGKSQSEMSKILNALFPDGIPPHKYDMLSEWMEVTREFVS